MKPYEIISINTPVVSRYLTPPNFNMQFSNQSGVIGTLDFNGQEMTFDGSADESARTFFDFLAKCFSGRLEQEYQKGYQDALLTKQS